MIEVTHLSKAYGAHLAVDDISFHVDKGEVVGFLGPNGAGKSTTLRILSGFLGATLGRVRIAGHDIQEEPLLARKGLGYMPETSPLYPEMRVSEYLSFRAELKQIERAKRKEAIGLCIAQTHIGDVADVLIGHLSKGYRQRVGLADALLGSPPLLILDEPTAGLDPNQIREVRALIRSIGKDHTVFLSTHILPEVESTCTRGLVISKGKLVAQGSIDEIRALRKPSALQALVRGNEEKALPVLKAISGVRKVIASKQLSPAGEELIALHIELKKKEPIGALSEKVAQALIQAGLHLRELSPQSASLEQVFAELTQEQAPDQGEAQPNPEESGP